MIDLKKFTKEHDAIIPIIDGWGQYKSRRIYKPKLKDGFYKVLSGLQQNVLRTATPLEVYHALSKQKKYMVYAFGQEGIPVNFENFFRIGFGESVRVFFLNLDLFEAAEVVLWEDKRFYFFDNTITKNRTTLQEIRKAFENQKALTGIKGVTPEQRYYFLLTSLTRDGLKVFGEIERLKLSDNEKKRRVKELESQFPIRLQQTVEKAGGKFIKYSKKGNGFLVEWIVNGQKIKSHIQDNMRVINAGFCLSGGDKAHSMNSIVQLAKLFQEDAPLYLTRE